MVLVAVHKLGFFRRRQEMDSDSAPCVPAVNKRSAPVNATGTCVRSQTKWLFWPLRSFFHWPAVVGIARGCWVNKLVILFCSCTSYTVPYPNSALNSDFFLLIYVPTAFEFSIGDLHR